MDLTWLTALSVSVKTGVVETGSLIQEEGTCGKSVVKPDAASKTQIA